MIKISVNVSLEMNGQVLDVHTHWWLKAVRGSQDSQRCDRTIGL
jgi:hypothetical protein